MVGTAPPLRRRRRRLDVLRVHTDGPKFLAKQLPESVTTDAPGHRNIGPGQRRRSRHVRRTPAGMAIKCIRVGQAIGVILADQVDEDFADGEDVGHRDSLCSLFERV